MAFRNDAFRVSIAPAVTGSLSDSSGMMSCRSVVTGGKRRLRLSLNNMLARDDIFRYVLIHQLHVLRGRIGVVGPVGYVHHGVSFRPKALPKPVMKLFPLFLGFAVGHHTHDANHEQCDADAGDGEHSLLVELLRFFLGLDFHGHILSTSRSSESRLALAQVS